MPVVVSFGKIDGGQAFNVIADRVKLLGTVRCLDAKLNETLPQWIEDTVKGIANSLGAEALVTYTSIAPPVCNDPGLTSIVEEAGNFLLGEVNVKQLESPSLGAEDFAELIEDVPGTMFRLGVAPPEGCAPLHNGYFSPDEKSIDIGIRVMFQTLMTWMEIQKLHSRDSS